MQIAKSVDAIPVHEDAASRALLLPNPQIDQLSFNKGTMAFERWNGTAWVTVVASGEHIPTYADAATRDANIPVPTLDQKVVLSSTGEMQRWNGASWQTLVVGAQGPQGLLGPKGDKGDLGPQGPAGTAGAALTVQPTHAAFLAYTPSEGVLVLDAERQLTNAYTAGQYRQLADRPWESVNPKSYGAKADSGSSTITSTDIANHPEWCDLYVAGDTWDFVGWQEAFFAAFAQSSSRQEFTVQAGSTSTSIALSAGAVTANQYRGGSLWVVTGAGKMTGTPVRVTSHDTSHLVLASALGTVPLAGDKVMVIQWNGDGAAQNRPFVAPGGNYGVNRTLFLQHVLGGVLMGAGRMVVSLTGLTKRIPIVVTNGMTFSDWSGIQFISGSGNWYDYDWSAGRTVNVGDWILPAMDGWLWQCTTAGVTGSTMPNFGDGNSGEAPVTDGTAVWTQKLRTPLFQANWDGSTESWNSAMQGNTWRNCRFTAEGRGVPVGLSMAESGDGVMGSENTFFNCHWMWFSLAGYYSNGMNAFQNTHIGGNFSNCSKHAIFAARGAFYCYSIGFQNGWQSQYQNNGSDIRADNSAGDCSDVSMCRSESLIFARFGNDHRVNIRGSYAHGAQNEWAPTTAYTVGAWVIGRQANGKADGRIYQCMVAGTSSATEPDWIAQIRNNNFTDGTVQWQLVEFSVISGTAMIQLCAFGWGQLAILYGGSIKGVVTTRSDAVKGTLQGGSPHVSTLDIQGLHVYTNGNVAEASFGRRTSSPLGWTRAPVVAGGTDPATAIRRRRDEPAFDYMELGSGGSIYFSTPTDSVGIRRGDTARDFSGLSAETRRILAVVGKLGKLTPSLFESNSPDEGSGATLAYPTDARGIDFHVVGGLSTGAKPGGRWIAETADAGPSGAVVNYPHPRLGIVGGGLVVAPGLGADPVYRDMARTITYDPPSIAANSVATVDVDFFGAVLGDAATAGFSLPLGGLLMFAAVQANDLVRVTLFNPTAGAIDLASGTLRVEVRSRQAVATGTGDIAQLITALGGNALHPRFYDVRVASSLTLAGGLVTSLADARGGGFGSTLGQRGTATKPVWDAQRGVIQFTSGQGLTAPTNDVTLSGDNTIVLIAAVGDTDPFGAQGLVGVGVNNESGIGIRNHSNGTGDYAHIAAIGAFSGNGTGVGATSIATETLRDSENLRLMFITVSGGNTLTLEVMDEAAASPATGTLTPGTGTYAFNLGSFDGASQHGVQAMLFKAGWHATKAYTAQEKQLIRLWAMSRHNFHAAAK